MKTNETPYQLIQTATGEMQFAAAFVKYYQDTPFCALFEEYPAERTKILACRRITEDNGTYGYRLADLVSYGPSGKKVIGQCIQLFEATSEQEVEERLIANMVGVATIRRAVAEEEFGE